jgi:hypothetical protein
MTDTRIRTSLHQRAHSGVLRLLFDETMIFSVAALGGMLGR